MRGVIVVSKRSISATVMNDDLLLPLLAAASVATEATSGDDEDWDNDE